MEDPGSGQDLGPLLPFQVVVPFMTRQRYAELTGISLGVVDAWVDRGYVPSRVVGKRRLVNIAALWRQAFEAEGYL